jgi:hypothetical protein
MEKENYRILTINPGSKYLGVALFIESELRMWNVYSLSYLDMKKRVAKVSELIRKAQELHGVTTVVIKKTHPSRSSTNLNILIRKIKEIIHQLKLTLHEYTICSIKAILLPGQKGNKNKLMDEIVALYPHLSVLHRKELKNKNKYYIRMFEAVSLGMVFLNENI